MKTTNIYRKTVLRNHTVIDFVDIFCFILWLACILIVLAILKGGI